MPYQYKYVYIIVVRVCLLACIYRRVANCANITA